MLGAEKQLQHVGEKKKSQLPMGQQRYGCVGTVSVTSYSSLCASQDGESESDGHLTGSHVFLLVKGR
jgi:hypothetical protein